MEGAHLGLQLEPTWAAAFFHQHDAFRVAVVCQYFAPSFYFGCASNNRTVSVTLYFVACFLFLTAHVCVFVFKLLRAISDWVIAKFLKYTLGLWVSGWYVGWPRGGTREMWSQVTQIMGVLLVPWEQGRSRHFRSVDWCAFPAFSLSASVWKRRLGCCHKLEDQLEPPLSSFSCDWMAALTSQTALWEVCPTIHTFLTCCFPCFPTGIKARDFHRSTAYHICYSN